MNPILPMDPQESSQLIPPDATDDNSYTTYDYMSLLHKNCFISRSISAKVYVHTGNTNDTTVATDSHSATPILSAGSEKALPKYSGKYKDDVNEFIYKFRIFLNHSSINNCHLDLSTTDSNRKNSKNLAALLSFCIHGNALSPFIDNPKYNNKGIEMFHHLMDM